MTVTGWRVAHAARVFGETPKTAVETTALPEAIESPNPNLTRF
jgi:hypothetical protein